MNTINHQGQTITVSAIVTDAPKSGRQPWAAARGIDGTLYTKRDTGRWAVAYTPSAIALAQRLLGSQRDTHTYEIGGVCVTMTETQAEIWNRGDASSANMAGAYVSIPRRSGTRSYLRDGEVIVQDGQPYEDSVPLWDYIGGDGEPSEDYTAYMEGRSAVRTRDR